MNEKISVIIPVYNVAIYLRKCIESVIAQTYKELEIIIVDDGSTDDSSKICDEYAQNDSRIIVIHQKNGGLSAARNRGLDEASGKYISFVDADDYIEKEMFELLLNRMTVDKSNLVICDYYYVDEQGNNVKQEQLNPLKDECITKEKAFEYLTRYGGYYGIACSKLYRRELFLDLRFPLGKKYEDTFVIHETLWKCDKISHISQKLYNYVQRNGSIMSEPFSIRSMDYGDAMILQYQFGKKHSIDILKHYAAMRLSYKIDEWSTCSKNTLECKKKYKEIKRKSMFLLFDSGAWKYANWKGKLVSKIKFIFS